MADIIQTPGPTNSSGGGSAAGWAVAIVILLAVIAWFVFGGGLNRQTTYRADVKVTPPAETGAARSPSSARPDTGGSAGGEVTVPPKPQPQPY